ncbi:hypothetical protein LTR97_009837 [Elasticomyces elasticus]|uniref:Uncharacterized protein n=1 Tax=Elasticomyces elasticus TaxID=574655 RepID=A0AAN7ZZJ9_9PEZI|nr:hypothetical protein LTR97_009837 [Elasticomyces elasticus]
MAGKIEDRDAQATATPTLDAAVSSSLLAAFSSATASGEMENITQFANMSTLDFDLASYALNDTQTGCYRKGALPVALAQNDTCLPGWHSLTKLMISDRSGLECHLSSAILPSYRTVPGQKNA